MTTVPGGGSRALLTRTLPRSQRWLVGLLALIAACLLGGVLTLTVSMLGQTHVLSDKVDLTQDIVDANVRTLSQVQREVLRLEVLLEDDGSTPQQLRLQTALLSQRVQEGTLSYQMQTLGSEQLLDQARTLQAQWRSELRPLAADVVRGGRGSDAARSELLTRLPDFELAYNQLVSDGENNRKAMAGQANSETQQLLRRADRLVEGLLATFVALGILVIVTGLTFASFHRSRGRAAATLVRLNDELRRHAHVVAATDNMVVVTDAQGRIDWVNPAFESTTGWELAEVRGRTPGSVLQRDDVDPTTVAAMGSAIRAGRSFNAEVLNHARDGRAYWASVDVNPLTTPDGEITGFVAVQSDITERRHSQELLRSAKEAAEETAREKSTFLASMSHEIRTPLNAVLGLTDLLLLTDLDDDQREYARTAHSSGRLLLALVNDILDFSAMESGRIELEDVPLDLHGLLRDTLGMFEPTGRRQGVEVRLEIDPEVPAYVRGDETRLRQVLVNLVGNALKFTERGAVTMGAAVDGDELCLRVRDTGIGIPVDRMERLFQPFTQVDASTTRRYGGTGLGLAICRLSVQRMQGRIDVDSTPGSGSEFVVRVPLQPADAADVIGPEIATPRPLHGLRVLLAEDDMVNQTVARHMLRRLGIEPVVVADGQAAVEAALAQEFDVILMDVHMPGTDGVQAAGTLRELLPEERRPWVVAVTANALEGDREKLLAAGMDSYLSKPVQLGSLQAQLELVMDHDVDTSTDDAHGNGGVRPAAVDEEEFVRRTGLEMPDLIRTLATQVAAQAAELAQAAPGLTHSELGAAAHRLRGAAGSAAATGVETIADRLEQAALRDQAPTAEISVMAAELALEASRVEAWLDEHTQDEHTRDEHAHSVHAG